MHGYNRDTDAGGRANELMTNTRKWNGGIVARGRIYFAADNKSMLLRYRKERLHLLRQQPLFQRQP